MKKLLSLFEIFTATSLITMNETSCFWNKKEKAYDVIADKISNAQNIFLRDDSTDASVTNKKDKTVILNQIGLTSEEQEYVINLSGTLTVDVASEITFNIAQKPGSTIVYKTLTNDVTWQQINKLNDVMISGIASSQNLSIINDRQLIISGVTGDGTYISDQNLNFTNNSTISDGCVAAPNWISFYNENLYLSISGCGFPYIEKHTLSLDDEGNYYPPTSRKNISCNVPKKTVVSNNILYVSTTNLNEWIVNNDDTATQITNTSEVKDKSQYIWNANGTLYVGTTTGLYKSIDDGTTWTLIPNTDTLNITSIIGTIDGSQLFFTTTTDLYASNDGQTFTSIYTGTNLNPNSLFISQNSNLYFGDQNLGLYQVALDDLTNVQPVVLQNISATDNVKNLVQTVDGTILILTNSHVVYSQE